MRAYLFPIVLLFACSDSSPSAPTPVAPGVDAGGNAPVPTTCPTPTGTGTKHTTAAATETWTAATGPHIVEASLSIAAGTTITIEPCAVVQMKGGVGLLVEGKLLAEGTADKPIRIERLVAGTAWSTIEARKGAEIRLSYTTVEGSGGFDLRGDQELATQPTLFADNVLVKDSEGIGITVREGGGFAPGSKDLGVTGGKSFPVSIWGRAVGTLPTGVYTGNAKDEIVLPAAGGRDDIKEDTTLADRGVPYQIGGPALIVTKGSLLTVAAGVTLRFVKASRLAVDGALRLDGTADKPVLLTSAEATPAAGNWVGILFEEAPDARTAINYAKIAYAGGPSQISSFGCTSPGAPSFANDAAIVIAGNAPSTAFVKNTTIEASAGEGVVRGWTGAEVDFLATNTFTNVARCNQTLPKPEVGACPATPPCPK